MRKPQKKRRYRTTTQQQNIGASGIARFPPAARPAGIHSKPRGGEKTRRGIFSRLLLEF